MSPRVRYAAIASIIGIIVIAALAATGLHRRGVSQNPQVKTIRLSLPPYTDNYYTVLGQKVGIFTKYGLNIEFVETTWERQYELIAAREVAMAMSTLDEFVSKDSGLRAIDRRVYYILPAWQFAGLGFFASKNSTVLDTGPRGATQAERLEFLNYLKSRKIVYPEGSVFQQAFTAFVESSGLSVRDFQIVNAPLDTALNSLEDSAVGLAAIGTQQRYEAIRRGYREAIPPRELGMVIITGFVATPDLTAGQGDVLKRFACAWYETMQYVKAHEQEMYEFSSAALEKRGAQRVSFDEYLQLRSFNILPVNLKDVNALFFEETGGAYWRAAWDATVNQLRRSGKGSQIPPDQSGFIAQTLVNSLVSTCPDVIN